jgi:hypothetical protein
MLSHDTVAPKAPQTTEATKSNSAKVLGSATTEQLDTTTPPSAAPTAPTTTPATPAAPVATPTTPPVQPSSATTVTGSFALAVDASKITHPRTSLLLTVPFTVQRHGNLTTPIVPGDVSVTSGGMLIAIQVQSKMLNNDSGVITILPVGISTGTLNVHFSASSGEAIASTSFSYKL